MKISVILEMLTADFETDAKRAEKALDKAAKEMEATAKRAGAAIGAGLLAGATAMAALTKKAIDTADQLSKLSQASGVSVESLSGLKFAAEQSGTSIEGLAKGMQKLAKDAESGGAVLKRAGISATDAAGRLRPVEDVLLDVADKFASMKDGAEKAAYAQELFGKSGAQLIPFLNAGRDGIKELTDQAARLGLVMDGETAKAAEQFNDNLDALKGAAVGLGNDMAKVLLPALVDVTNAAVAFVEKIRADGTLAKWGEDIKTVVGYLDELAVFITARLVAGALASLIVSLTTTTGTFTLATAAANTFRLALALAGGPVGLLVTAMAGLAVAVYSHRDAASDARDASDALKKATDDLNASTGAGIAPALAAAEAKREVARASLEAAKASLQELQQAQLLLQQYTQASSTPQGAAAFTAIFGNIGPALQGLSDGLSELGGAVSQAKIDELAQEIARLSTNLDGSGDSFDKAKQRAAEFLASLKGGKPDVDALGDSAKDLAEKQKLLEESAKKAAEEQQKLADAFKAQGEAATAAAGDLGKLLDEQAAALGGPVVAAAISYRNELRRIYDDEVALLNIGPMTAENTARLAQARTQAAERYQNELGDIKAAELEAADRADTVANRVRDTWAQAAQQMSYAWGDLLTGQLDSFDDFADAIKNIWLRAIADMIAANAQSGFTNLIGSLFGGMGAQGGGGTFNIASLFGGGAFAGAAGGAAGVAGVGAQGILAGGGGLFTGSGLSTAFAGIPVIGWIAAAVMANFSLMRSGWAAGGGNLTLPNGQTVHGGGSASAQALDNLARAATGLFGVSNTVAGILSGSAIHNRLFGHQAPVLTGSTTSLTFGADGVGGSEAYRTLERGGVFSSDRRRTRTYGLSADAQDQAQAIFDQLSAVVADAAARMKGEAPGLIDAALKIVQEFDGKGKVKSTKYLVEALGKTWEEATAELAVTRLSAENIINTIDTILAATGDAAATAGASAIAERWRGDAEELMAGAQFLLAAATDIRAGVGLLGEGGTLGDITTLIEDLQTSGETMIGTYARVSASTALLTEALDLSGVSLDLTREQFVRFATDITTAAGGLERANALWSSYFQTFYSDQERALLSLNRARDTMGREFADIGLDPSQFQGSAGAAAFRQMFEELLPTLGADAVVQWLEAANALGIVIDLTGQYSTMLGTTADNLGDFMAGIDAQLSDLAPDPSITERIAALAADNQALVDRAIELGASEAELARVRELGQIRMNSLLDEQAQLLDEQAAALAAQQAAGAELSDFLANLAAQAGGGITPMTSELQRLRGEYQANIDRIEELARASGRAGASTEELAVATSLYRTQVQALEAQLMSSAQSIIARLYGSATGSTTTASSGSGGWVGASPDMSGIGQINDAIDERYTRELGYLNQISDWLDSLDLSALSPLTPQERLSEAAANYQNLLARAQSGDLDALEQLQQAAQAYLQEAQTFFGGVGEYRDIFESVRTSLAGLVAAGPQNSPGPTGDPANIGGYGGGPGGIVVEAGDSFQQLSALERATMANELTGVLRDLIAVTGSSLVEVSDQLGLDLTAMVTDLGVNLDSMTVATTLQLADISRNLGVDLTTLASSVGFSLGDLGDEQSLLNDALESVINGLPTDIRDQLNRDLDDIERATQAGNPISAIQAMEDAINLLSPDIAAALAPFFGGVAAPTDSLLAVTVGQAADIAAIRGLLEDPPAPEAAKSLEMSDGAKSVRSNVVEMAAYRAQAEALRAEVARGNKLMVENNELQREIARKVGSGAGGPVLSRSR